MIYVGTNHGDFKGKERMKKVIRYYNPKVISVEWPDNQSIEEAFSSVLKRRFSLLQREFVNDDPGIQYLRDRFFNNLGFEFEVGFELSKLGVCVVPVDFADSKGSDMVIKEVSAARGLSREDLVVRYENLIQRSYDGEGIGRLLEPLLGLDMSAPFINGLGLLKRDDHMALKIREVKPDMHFVGLCHVYGYYDFPNALTLWDMACQSGDVRMKLCDIDRLV